MTKQLIGIVLIGLLGYGLLEAWPLIAGPSLSIESPTEGASFEGGIATIRGKAPRASELTLNGSPLLYEKDGRFSTTLTFPAGSSILTFAAADRFGRRVTETRTIFIP